MRPAAGCRAALGLGATGALAALLVPRSLPRLDLLDPAARASEVTQFGLRSLAALLAGYLALVFMGLFLAAARLLPAATRHLVERWTSGGLAGALRRCVGLSALAFGVLPLQPVAAHAAESAPVLAPADPAPPTAAPRLEPGGPTRQVPTAPEPPDPGPPDLRPPGSPPPLPVPPIAEPPVPISPNGSGRVTVEPGDSFWTVAARLVSARLGRPAGDGEVVELWLALIDANRDLLPDAEDPDLLFPGQVLRLPD